MANELPNVWDIPPVVRGNGLSFDLRIYGSGGSATNLSGATVGMAISSNPYFSGTGDLYLYDGSGLSMDRSEGLIYIRMTATNIDSLPIYTPSFYKINIEEVGLQPVTYVQGKISVNG